MAEEAPPPPTNLPTPSHPSPPNQQTQPPPPQPPAEHPAPTPFPPPTNDPPDTEMGEATTAIPSPAAAAPQAPAASTPAPPQRTATPNRNVEVAPPPPPPPTMPVKASSHGAPARRYLNERVTGVLLQGMKRLAAEQPEDPLRVLGEFLLQRSKELEGL